jgi:hypothetical protein
MGSAASPHVIPAQAGIQSLEKAELGARFRGHDTLGCWLLYLRPDLTRPKCHPQKSFGWDWPQAFMSFPRKRESRAWESRARCTLSRARHFDCGVR